ncbi:hypothetical protein Trydic_g761 [Trypoxylus dichotomus]
MKHMDALSRVYDVNLAEEYDLRALQAKDAELSEIKSKLANSSKFQKYILINGLVMKPYDGRNLLVIPRIARKEVVWRSHEGIAHLRAEKTVDEIKQKFYFKNVMKFTRKCMAKCLGKKPNYSRITYERVKNTKKPEN